MKMQRFTEQERLMSYYDQVLARLFADRIIFMSGTIVTGAPGRVMQYVGSEWIVSQMLSLEAEDAEKDIQLYINSPGGDVSAALAIYDTMQTTKCPVRTICVGVAASAAALILAGGAKGKRFSLPNSKILIHQPWVSGVGGQAVDVKIYADEIMKTRDRVNEILAKHTGQPKERIEKDTDRDYWMSAEEAKTYGIVDEIIQPRR
ncbi:TPA: ATP-dependent Clp protease proteolytic subunit [Candidatus Acetothermia bacterium]|nr:ATP-dependent Clp protease proteolytic subunit [Candidatus Acetothermia bacterium]